MWKIYYDLPCMRIRVGSTIDMVDEYWIHVHRGRKRFKVTGIGMYDFRLVYVCIFKGGVAVICIYDPPTEYGGFHPSIFKNICNKCRYKNVDVL